MAKSGSGIWLYALGEVQRPNMGVEVKEGERRPVEIVAPRSVFEATDKRQADELTRLLAVREATNEEVTLEKDRRERAGEGESESEIVASVPQDDPQKTKAPKAQQANSKPPKPSENDDVL